jgi:hypothetical protein
VHADKDILTISITLVPKEKKFLNYLPQENIDIKIGRTDTMDYVMPLNPRPRTMDYESHSILEKKFELRGLTAGAIIDMIIAQSERPTKTGSRRLKAALTEKLNGFGQLIDTEEMVHGVMHGWMDSATDRTSRKYRIFSEFSAGAGLGDILLRKEISEEQLQWTDVIGLIELKQAVIPAYITLQPLERQKAIESKIDAERKTLDRGFMQATYYSGDIKYATDGEKVTIAAIGIYPIRNTGDVRIMMKLESAVIRHSSIYTRPTGASGCESIEGPSTSRAKRSIRCWEDATEDKLDEMKITGGNVDKEGFLRYLEGVQEAEKAKMISIFKNLRHRGVPKNLLESSPCGNRLPSSGCLDQYNADLSSEHSAKKLIDDLFKHAPEHVTPQLSGSGLTPEHAPIGPASATKPILWIHERVYAPVMAKLYLLEEPALYANRALFAVDLLSKAEDLILRHDITPTLKTARDMGIFQASIITGYYLEKVYNDYGIKAFIEMELSQGYGAVAEETVYSLTKISLIGSLGMVPLALRVLPTSALNVFAAGLSAKRIYDVTQMEGVNEADRLYVQLVEGCNVVAKIGQVFVAVSAQAELEPVVMLIQVGCGVGAYVGGRYLMVLHLSDDINISFWENVRAYIPFINNLDDLQNNQKIKVIYEGHLLPNGTFPVQFDAIILSLPHVVVFDDGKTCNEVQLNDTSLFLHNNISKLNEDFGYYLVYPLNAEAYINSVDNETACTASMSRTLTKIGSDQPEVKIFCAPTGENAEKKPMPELVCDGQAANFFSVHNLDSAKGRSAAEGERNFCSHTMGLLNNNGTTGKHVYDVRARGNATTIAGNGNNLIFYYNNSYIVGGRSGSNRIVLHAPFNASRISLDGTASNTLTLNCQNFTEQDAHSQAGGRVATLVGSAGCVQEIHVPSSASYVYTGGNTTVHVRSESHSVLHIEASAGDHVDLTHCEGVVFIDIEEGAEAVTIVLPRLHTMMLSRRVHIRLVGEGSEAAAKVDVFNPQHVLNRYHYFYEADLLTVSLADADSAFLKIHIHGDLLPIRLDVSLDTWLVIFPPLAGPTQPCVDVHYKMHGNPGFFEEEKADYYRKVSLHLGSTKNLLCMRAYAEDKQATIVVHNTLLPLRTSLDFAYNSNKSSTLLKLRGERNVVFLEYCRSVEVQFDLAEHQNYSVYFLAEGAKIKDVFSRGNSLVVEYECPGLIPTTVIFHGFFPAMFADKHVTLYSESEVRQVDSLDTFPIDAFSAKILPAGPAWKKERVFHFHDGSINYYHRANDSHFHHSKPAQTFNHHRKCCPGSS